MQALKAIGAKAKMTYELFHLSTAARTWIISLGLKKQPHPHRGSRAGRSLFGRIHTRITNRTCDKDDSLWIKPKKQSH